MDRVFVVSVGEALSVQGWRIEEALDLRIVVVRRLRSWKSQRVLARRSAQVLHQDSAFGDMEIQAEKRKVLVEA